MTKRQNRKVKVKIKMAFHPTGISTKKRRVIGGCGGRDWTGTHCHEIAAVLDKGVASSAGYSQEEQNQFGKKYLVRSDEATI